MPNKIDELNDIRQKLTSGGGEKLVSMQHDKGKLTARERVVMLFDEGTFVETGLFINSSMKDEMVAEGIATGYGQINGRLVYAVSDDYTVLNGSLGKVHIEKILKCQLDAIKLGVPIVYIFDSSGIRVEEGLETLSSLSKVIKNISNYKGIIPQISIILGQCAGTLSFASALTDFVFMVENTSKMFLNGKVALIDSDKVGIDDSIYGSAKIHASETGIANFVSSDEKAAISSVRILLSYLPQNNREVPECAAISDDLNRVCESLNKIDYDNDYDIKNVINEIADSNSFFEVSECYAKNVITGFINLGGIVVGVIANNKKVLEGDLDIASSKKIENFITTLDSFNIPILTLVDSTGFVKTYEEEKNGNLKSASDIIFAYSNANVPMVTLVINNAIGASYVCMGNKDIGVDEVLSFPNAKIAVMNENVLLNILYNDELKKATADEKKEMLDKLEKEKISPYVAASMGLIDDIIEPKYARMRLISAFDKLLTKAI